MDDQGFSEIIDESLPAPTHNKPPISLRVKDDLRGYLDTTHAAIFKRANDLIAAEARLPAITNAVSEATATEYVKLIQTAVKELDRIRLIEKNAYDECADLIHASFRGLMDKLARPTPKSPAALKERVEAALTAYKLIVAAAERKVREEAAQRAREAEDAARRQREEEERAAQREQDRLRREREAEEARIREQEDARRREAEEAERQAAAAAREAELVASRKRTEENRVAADAAAADARRIADEAAEKRRHEQIIADQARREREDVARAADAQAEEDRRQREALAREAEDKAANERALAEAAATVSDADLSRARGARGGVSSLTTFWDMRDLDRATIDLEALRDHISFDALEKAVRSYKDANKERLEGGHQIRGVVFFKNHRTGTR